MEILIYLAIGLSISFLILGFILLGDGKVLWKQNDLFILFIVVITVMIGWLPIVLIGLCILGVLWGMFSCKKI